MSVVGVEVDEEGKPKPMKVRVLSLSGNPDDPVMVDGRPLTVEAFKKAVEGDDLAVLRAVENPKPYTFRQECILPKWSCVNSTQACTRAGRA